MVRTLIKAVVKTLDEEITFKLIRYQSKANIVQYRVMHNTVLLGTSQELGPAVHLFWQAVEKATDE